MPKQMLDFFVYPSSSEEETQLVGRWLRSIFLYAIGILTIFAAVVFSLHLDIDTLIFIGFFIFVFIGLLAVLQKGYIRLASTLLNFIAMAGLLFAAYRFGGVRSTSYNSLIIVIILSALFLRGRLTIITTAISIIAGLCLLWVELNGFFQPDRLFLDPIIAWISSTMMFIIVAVLLGITARQVRTSIRQTSAEIIERKHAEDAILEKSRYQSALHETTIAIINRLELIPLFESILTRAEELADTQHGYIELLIQNGDKLQQMVGHGIFGRFNGAVVDPDLGVSGEVLRTSKTQIVENYKSWPKGIPEYAAAGFETIVSVPLYVREQIVGTIGLAYTQPGRKFSETQLEILDQFAELAALAIENARLYQASLDEIAERKLTQEALLRSEENLRVALDAASMGTWEWDIFTQKVNWSENVYEIFGISSENFKGSLEDYLAICYPADRQKLKSQIENSVKHPEEPFSVEHRILWRGSTIRWLEGRGKIHLDESGKPANMAGTVADITKRVEAEQALRKANQRLKKDTLVLKRRSTLLQVAAEVSRAASAILDPDQLGQEVVNLVRKRFKLYYVGLFLIDATGSLAKLRAATGKAGRNMLANGHQLEIGPTSMVGWCIANRQARIALDVGEDAVRFNNPLLPQTRSELALPLTSRGQVLGAISVQSKDATAFSPLDIETFQTMTDQLANAILNARLYSQVEMELEERTRAEEAIRLLNNELEVRVGLRTADLQASEEKFRALSENNPLQITRYDREGRYLYANRVGRNDLLKPKDVIGKKLREVLTANGALVEFCEACIRQVAETGKPLNTEYADDDYYGLWSLTPEFSPDGSVISVITSTMDITERKHMEEELHQRSAELQAANHELEAFSYSVSHDLRAPLRAIDGFSRILMQDYKEILPGDASQHLQRISTASLHMGQLIDDMLRLSRITRSELHENQVNLSELAELILGELASLEPERNVSIEIQAGMMVMGDERLLHVALENLLNNAWKFTGKVENAVIQVGLERQGMEKVVFIRDNGVGFDMAYADKLFGAFQRLHSVVEFPGTGIGLAIVQRVIHKHGGRIWAKAQKGNGATFYFAI
jgi:PAS domain S-box-containing protein